MAFPFSSRPQAPLLAVLALAGAACFGGSRSVVSGPMPSPLGAGGSVAAIVVERDSAPVSSGNGSAALKTAAPGTKARAAKRAAPKAPAAKRTAPPDRGSAARSVPRVKVDSTALEFAVTARLAHEPLTRAIARRTRNPELAERAA